MCSLLSQQHGGEEREGGEEEEGPCRGLCVLKRRGYRPYPSSRFLIADLKRFVRSATYVNLRRKRRGEIETRKVSSEKANANARFCET